MKAFVGYVVDTQAFSFFSEEETKAKIMAMKREIGDNICSVSIEIYETNSFPCCPDMWTLILVLNGYDFLEGINQRKNL